MNVENKTFPVITSENDVYPYLKKINTNLTDEEEKKLAINWLKMVTLRLHKACDEPLKISCKNCNGL